MFQGLMPGTRRLREECEKVGALESSLARVLQELQEDRRRHCHA